MTMDERAAIYRVKEIIEELRAWNSVSCQPNDIYTLETLLNSILKRDEDIKHLIEGMRTYEKRLGIPGKFDDEEYLKHDECRICGKNPAVYCKVCYNKVTDEKDKAERMVRSYKEREQAILDVLGVDW